MGAHHTLVKLLLCRNNYPSRPAAVPPSPVLDMRVIFTDIPPGVSRVGSVEGNALTVWDRSVWFVHAIWLVSWLSGSGWWCWMSIWSSWPGGVGRTRCWLRRMT